MGSRFQASQAPPAGPGAIKVPPTQPPRGLSTTWVGTSPAHPWAEPPMMPRWR